MLNKIKKGFDKVMKEIKDLSKFMYHETMDSKGLKSFCIGVFGVFVGLGIVSVGSINAYVGFKEMR